MKSANDIKKQKNIRQIAVLTCYDYITAKIIDNTNLDMILVGDSLAEIIYGENNTTSISMEIMLNHVKAVGRGAPHHHIIADMPFNSYNSPTIALKNADQFIKVGANSVKLENPSSEVIHELISNNIEVMGHIGLTPQTIHDYKLQGKDNKSADIIIADAKRLSKAGCFAIVLEAIPSKLAKKITGLINIPTIGIAAGKNCDGQILVLHDMLGFDTEERQYVQKKADFYHTISISINSFISDTTNIK